MMSRKVSGFMLFMTFMVNALMTIESAPQSSPPDPASYVCYRASSPIVVDGKLEEPSWRNAAWSTDFVDIEGQKKPTPALQTHLKLLWDDVYFYLGAELIEPHVWATLTAHDSVIFHDNDFEVFIDPNGDSHEYYELEINALGTTWDLLLPRPYKDGGKPINNWEIAGLKSAVHVDGTLNDPRDRDKGWSIELAIPWNALAELARRPAPPHDRDQWRVNFSRVEWPIDISNTTTYRKRDGENEHNWVWSPQGVVDMHRPESWGYVQFSTEKPGTDAFIPDPSRSARVWLQAVYYAQREYQRVHGRWALRLDDFNIARPSDSTLSAPTLEVTSSLFEASITLTLKSGVQHWHIRQDALVWSD